MELPDVASRIATLADELTGAATRLAGTEPGPNAFAADGPGALFATGAALRADYQAALAAREREVTAHGARLTGLAARPAACRAALRRRRTRQPHRIRGGAVSDLLDRVAEPGLDLLHRVDAALASAGAPADDPVWPLLRRAGALPGEILSHLLGADPAALPVAGDDVRAESVALSRAVDAVPGPAGWRGHAADEFAAQWSAAAGQVDRITERLTATADHAPNWPAGSPESVGRSPSPSPNAWPARGRHRPVG